MSDETKAKLQAFWKEKTYLIIYEFSMISKSCLAKLSSHVSIGKQGSETYREGISFGGTNIILCGDLHQFPPVAKSPRERLYKAIDLAHDSLDAQIGRTLYEEFETVIILKEQIRVTDNN